MPTDPMTPDLIALAEKLAGPFGTLRGIEWEQLQALAQLVLDQKKELDHIRALANVDPDCPLREALR